MMIYTTKTDAMEQVILPALGARFGEELQSTIWSTHFHVR